MTITTLKDILNNGGATLNKYGAPVSYKGGYQVSRKDCYNITIGNAREVLRAINELLNTITPREYVGIWVEAGRVYIDVSERINGLRRALQIARARAQISIYDWKRSICIYC